MISLGEAKQATGGNWLAEPLPPETPLLGGTQDTRLTAGNEIFFALKGETADGHDYLPALAGSGVKCAVVEKKIEIKGFTGNILLVEDVLLALGQMARFLVEKHRPKIIAITGSYGKTTTKEVVSHVLEEKICILKTPGSYNNEIGLPLSLLNLDGSQKAAVLEYSARKPGDIHYLCQIAPPDIAVVLAVGHAHIGVFGSQEAIYQTKTEIFSDLRPGGLALVNGEDPHLLELTAEKVPQRPVEPSAGARIQSFGGDKAPKNTNFRAEAISFTPKGQQKFTGIAGPESLAFTSGIPGPHGLYPILVAWAIGRELGLTNKEIQARAGAHPGQKGRAVLLDTPKGATLLDDTYNASPETIVNLIETLARMEAKERVLVLGPLAELETGLAQTATMVGPHLAPPLTRVILLERHQGFFEALAPHVSPELKIESLEGLKELIAVLQDLDAPGTVVGIKGARSAHMERAVEGMMNREVECLKSPCGLLAHCTACPRLTQKGGT